MVLMHTTVTTLQLLLEATVGAPDITQSVGKCPASAVAAIQEFPDAQPISARSNSLMGHRMKLRNAQYSLDPAP